jgi:polyisoprenoid-binding protein YceI
VRRARAAGLAVALALAAPAVALELHAVADSSRVEYHITHTISAVTDRAGTVSGRAEVDPARGTVHAARIEVDLRALQTGIEKRDKHIKSAEYLDVERFPTAVFAFSNVIPDSSAAAAAVRVRGALELHGVQRQIEIPLQLEWHPDRLRVGGAFTITLADHGIKQPKKMLFSAGKTVDVRLDLLFVP